jgi:O-methyltransferase involved in polyketide biosynthesis
MTQNWIELLPERARDFLCRPLLIWAYQTQVDPDYFSDDLAVETCRRLGLSPGQAQRRIRSMEMHRLIAREKLLDEMVKKHVHDRPDTIIINLGAALDTRFSRVDNGRLRWYDLDLPDIIHFRKSAYPACDRVRTVGRSVFDGAWPLMIERDESDQLIFLASGLLPYHPVQEVKGLMDLIAITFPGKTLYCDTWTSRARFINYPVPIEWFLNHTNEVKYLDHRLIVDQVWNTGDLYRENQPWSLRLRHALSRAGRTNQILKLRFKEKESWIYTLP